MTSNEKKDLHRAVFAAVYAAHFAAARSGRSFDDALRITSESGGAEAAYTVADQAVIDYEAWSPGGSAVG